MSSNDAKCAGDKVNDSDLENENGLKLKLDFKLQLTNFSMKLNRSIEATGITGIFGHSGSGKSTLLRIMSGLEVRAEGDLILGDKTLINSKSGIFLKPEKRGIAMVFQDSLLFPHLNVRENLEFAIKRRKKAKLHPAKFSLESVAELTNIDSFMEKPVTLLSGGEQQRVALARAVLQEPTLLLLDEPLSALDHKNKTLLLSLIVKVQQTLSIPIFYVSHSLSELQQVSDNLLTLHEGNVNDYGNIHEVIHRLNSSKSVDARTSLTLKVDEHLPHHGLTRLTFDSSPLGNNELYMPIVSQSLMQYDDIRCYVLSADISIVLSKPIESSIVNHLCGKITAYEQHGVSVLITVDCQGIIFYPEITSLSFEKLSLTIDKEIFIQFKASAVRTLLYK